MENLTENHATNQKSHEKELQDLMPGRVKKSTQHLTYNKMLEELAKHDDYKEAHKVKVICDAFEHEAEEKAKFDKNSKITSMLQTLAIHQQKELNVLIKKIDQARIILLRRRNQDFEKYSYY